MGRKAGNLSRQSLSSSIIIEDGDASIVSPETSASFLEFICKLKGPDKPTVDKIIGCKREVEELSRSIELFLKRQKPSFRLISGPPGSGKTCVVRKLADSYSRDKKFSFFYLKSSWLLDRDFTRPERRIRSLFVEALEKSPSLIFFDQIDEIFQDKKSEIERRISNTLMEEFENLKAFSARVLVLASTRAPETLDHQLKGPCYFRSIIQFKLPERADRKDILEHLTSCSENNLIEHDLEEIATRTHCYSFADLEYLCENASDCCLDRKDKKLTLEHFKVALSKFKPAAIENITSPHALLHWSDVGGNESAKIELQKSVIWPLKHRDRYKKLGMDLRKGTFMYGPPGCSKTMLAQALATESGFNFIAVKGPELITKYVGDSEAAVRKLYRNAREIAPCIIFFDEIDGLATERSSSQNSSVNDKIVATLLSELDGVEPLNGVFTIAASNRPHRLDSALVRPGRFHPAIYVPLPSEQDRREIFKVHLRKKSVRFDEPIDKIVEKLASQTDCYSGAEIAEICNVASEIVIEESQTAEYIEFSHLEMALTRVKPGTPLEDLTAYEKFQKRWRQNTTEKESFHETKTRSLQRKRFPWISQILRPRSYV